jgi:hypothetical protein
MNFFGFVFTIVTLVMLLRLPRNRAVLPFLMVTTWISLDQQINIGLHLPVLRILIAVGLLRVLAKGERMAGGVNSLDRMMLLWAIVSVCSLVFHKSSVVIFRCGCLYDFVGTYYLFRVFIQGSEDIRTVFKMFCIILLPTCATMLVEKLVGINPLAFIGFGDAYVTVTNGHFRASGPFAHPILAGTAGATCVPMAVYLWRRDRKLALAGLVATFGIVFASGSSGPIMTALSVLAAMLLWKIRGHLRLIRWSAAFAVFVLSFLMKDPVYFLLARIDITGGSTGYFRAQLIRSTIEHLNEWWFAGTDYTRHWMLTGIVANPDHTDMTNYYIQMGVWGGLLLMVVFMGILFVGFARVGRALQANKNSSPQQRFLIWTLGAILFGHVTTFFSISYFDQTIVLLCLSLAFIGSLQLLQRIPVSKRSWNAPPPRKNPNPARYLVYS